MKTFEQENSEILKSVIKNSFLYAFADKEKQEPIGGSLGLELYVTPECNQNCSYCYLCRHGEQLYPKELRNETKILNNLKIILNYLVENQLNPDRFDLFSGEIWDTDFGIKMLDTVLEAVKKGFKPRLMMIPSNFSFILNDEKLVEIEKRLEVFKEYKIRFSFSCSNDGKILDLKTRPFVDSNKEKGSDEYYEKLFNFCSKWYFGFHPMVAAHGIESWKENYKWWMDNLEKWNLNPLNAIMFLEVRNDDWDENAIIKYLEYLNFSVDYMIDKVFLKNGNNYSNALSLFNDWRLHRMPNVGWGHYSPLKLIHKGNLPGCTIHRNLTIRLGDLAIVPCHRTSYDEFVIGKIITKDDKIVDVEAKNIQIMNQVWLNNMECVAKCSSCVYKNYCMKGCYGSQFEVNQDMFYPCETVCNLYIARFIFLYHKYLKLGILNEQKEDRELFEIIGKIKETEEYRKWSTIAMELI